MAKPPEAPSPPPPHPLPMAAPFCFSSGRQAPVFRELYTEKAVVSEERRLRVDGAPLGSWQVGRGRRGSMCRGAFCRPL